MSKPQSALYKIQIITKQRGGRHTHNTDAGVEFETHCPLLVKPTAYNLLIQQQNQQ